MASKWCTRTIDGGPRTSCWSRPAGWRLQLGDARSLPFDDASFDLVTAAYLLHLLDREGVRSLLLEARRVLAGGGRLVAVTPLASPTLLGRAYAAGATATARLAPWLFSGLRSYNPQPALVSSGFRVVATRTVTKGYRSFCVRAEPCSRAGLPMSAAAGVSESRGPDSSRWLII
jgi:SAM-dependent methyltransferase